MRTHLGCKGYVELGALSEETQRKLEQVSASWLEFTPNPPSLVVRHVQPDDVSAPREIAGELLEFLSQISDAERQAVAGGALYYLDEQSGQYLQLRVLRGGLLTISWAHPDYSRGRWERYEGGLVAVVFEPYQRLNGKVKLQALPAPTERIRTVIERPDGLYPQGEYEVRSSGDQVEVSLHNVNSSVLPLIETLLAVAEPGSLEGCLDVSSFRTGDLDDYCCFTFKHGEAWVVRPSLWSDVSAGETVPSQPAQLLT